MNIFGLILRKPIFIAYNNFFFTHISKYVLTIDLSPNPSNQSIFCYSSILNVNISLRRKIALLKLLMNDKYSSRIFEHKYYLNPTKNCSDINKQSKLNDIMCQS